MSLRLRHPMRAALAALAFSAALPAFAAATDAANPPPAGSTITAVQSPAWLEIGRASCRERV